MNPDREDLDLARLVSAVGQVDPPSSSALDEAREVLWSAVTEEMLAANDARTKAAERIADQAQEAARQRRPDSSRPSEQHRNAGEGA